MNTCFACNDFTIWGVAAFLCAAIAVVIKYRYGDNNKKKNKLATILIGASVLLLLVNISVVTDITKEQQLKSYEDRIAYSEGETILIVDSKPELVNKIIEKTQLYGKKVIHVEDKRNNSDSNLFTTYITIK